MLQAASPKCFQKSLLIKVAVPKLGELFEFPDPAGLANQLPAVAALSRPSFDAHLVIAKVERSQFLEQAIIDDSLKQHFGIAHQVGVLFSVVTD
jgi:hypothetical protein